MAAHALSDVYAMGAVPLFALSLVGWPRGMDQETIATALQSATSLLSEESTPMLGGHTIESPEPLLGFTVIGEVDDRCAMLISQAKPGDQLILTKPLGSGVLITATKAGLLTPAHQIGLESVITTSNRYVSQLAVEQGVIAATDVSGFGLIGHLVTLLQESRLAAKIWWSSLPGIPGALELMTQEALVPNSTEKNHFTFSPYVAWNDCPLELQFLAADPQTSGGLLLCVPQAKVAQLLEGCRAAGHEASVIGQVVQGEPGHVDAISGEV